MSVIFRLADTAHDATNRTITAAHKAENAGYQHVQTGYDVQYQTYTVTADPPGQQHTGGER